VKTFSHFLAVATLAVCCSGCFPYRFTARPGASGRVIEAGTHSAVSGATISLSAPHGQVMTNAAADGFFRIPAEHRWGIYIIPMDPIRWRTDVTISAEGFTNARRPFIISSMGPGITDLGEIPMERAR